MDVIHAHLVLNREAAHCGVLIASSVVIASGDESIAGQHFRVSSQVSDFLEVIQIEVVSVDLVKLFAVAEVSSENANASQVRVKL